MKFAFFGTPRFAKITLEQIVLGGLRPDFVVCNPDRPSGRNKILTPPPVKVFAEENNIVVFQPEDPMEVSRQLEGLDFFVVAAYAKILSKELISKTKMGAIGVHPSLLPRYRGSTPIQSAILAGESKTGVTLYLLDEKMDHGPILESKEVMISGTENYFEMEEVLAREGGVLAARVLPLYLSNSIRLKEQDHAQATFTKKIKTEDANLEPEELRLAIAGNLELANYIDRKIRAYNPEPGAWTIQDGKRVKILRAKILENRLVLTEIQKEGKNPVRLNS